MVKNRGAGGLAAGELDYVGMAFVADYASSIFRFAEGADCWRSRARWRP